MKSIFVTVGTTKFDDLISVLLTTKTFTQLKNLGYDSIVIQSGNSNLSFLTDSLRQQLQSILEFEIFNFAPSLSEYMKNAELIISHGGAGCLFESLHYKKKVIAVINETLMGNHQEELASVLEEQDTLLMTTPSTISKLLENSSQLLSKLSNLKELEPATPEKFSTFILDYLK